MPAGTWVAVLAALGSAATFAFSTSLQHRAAGAESDAGFWLLRLLTRRGWLLGIGLSAVAFSLHALALHAGPLATVQPVVVTGVVFAVIVRSVLEHTLPPAAEIGWASVTWAGLAVFLVATGRHADEARHAPEQAVLVTGLIAAAALVVAAAAWLARTGTTRGLLLGACSGVLFGLVAALLKLVMTAGVADPIALLGSWPAWGLVLLGPAALAVNQVAYRTSRLSVTMPILNLVDLAVTIVFAVVVLGEVPVRTAAEVALAALGAAAMATGVVRLARLEETFDARADLRRRTGLPPRALRR